MIRGENTSGSKSSSALVLERCSQRVDIDHRVVVYGGTVRDCRCSSHRHESAKEFTAAVRSLLRNTG